MYTFLKFAPPGPCTYCILNVMDTQWDFSCDVACNIAKTRLHCATTCAMLCLHGEVHCLWCHKSRTRFYFFSHATSHKWSHGLICPTLHAMSHEKLHHVHVCTLTCLFWNLPSSSVALHVLKECYKSLPICVFIRSCTEGISRSFFPQQILGLLAKTARNDSCKPVRI